MRKLKSESGITLIEYVLLGAVLVVIFMGASIYLKQVGLARANSSMNTAETVVPCESGQLTGDQCF